MARDAAPNRKPWIKISVGYFTDPDVERVGMRAAYGNLRAIAWSRDELTDGHIPKHILRRLDLTPRDATALVQAGLWTMHPEGDGWRIRNYEKWQQTKAQVLAEREKDAGRKRRWRATHAGEPSNVRPLTDAMSRRDSGRTPPVTGTDVTP